MRLTDDERAVVFLDSFERLEYKHKAKLLFSLKKPSEIFTDKGLIERFFKAIKEEEIGSHIVRAMSIDGFIDEAITKTLGAADGVVTVFSENYPKELKETDLPPLALYYKGNVELLNAKRKFSIVGSRKTLEPYSLRAEEIAETLTKNGIVVVTGFAEGGDAAALGGAIKGGGAITVFAGGVDVVYPKRHEALAESVKGNGLIISEHRSDFAPKFYSFIMRNRIIAGLGGGVLIVSGNKKSGTRHTAEFALSYGREVCCFPYGFGESGSICKELIKNGAALVETAGDVAAVMDYKLTEQNKIEVSEEENSVLNLIKTGITDADDIITNSKLSVAKAIEVLTNLELKRLIARDSDSSYTLMQAEE